MYSIEQQIKSSEKENSRWHLIDTLRGIMLISMIFYHALYDLVCIWGINLNWFHGSISNIWQLSICSSFILISGFSWQLGKNHFKRGIIVYCCGILITAVTSLVIPQERIIYGILTFIGLMMLVMIPLNKILKKLNYKVGILIFVLLFLLTYNINNHYIGFSKWNLAIPDVLYKFGWLTIFGFPSDNFISSDYFSLIPWMFMYITGYYMYFPMSNIKNSKILKLKLPIINFLGKNTLIIYLIHQPIIYMLCYLIFVIIR